MVVDLLSGLPPIVRGILIGLFGVAFWTGGFVVAELLRRRWMSEDADDPST